jgi:signal-transduction protein with cAMP-binding, CBS, and nucleotidyltransferase domain
MEKIESVLRKHPFFKELKQEHLDILAGCASYVNFKAGETIFKEKQEVSSFCLIHDGLVALEVRQVSKPIIVETLQANDLLGWSWIFPPYQAHFDCHATKNTTLIAFDAKYLREKCERDHDFGYELMKRIMRVVAHRLEVTRIQLLNIYDS